MKMTEVRRMAKDFGLKTGGRKKADLVLAIQTHEGNFPCFGTAQGHCDQMNCCWREDCVPASSPTA